ncbi:MAG TPA: glycosyltransferase family 4 protein [Ignavibacteriaceae bacterium]|nr:glycosyltransferase family 4 protein [Ignavibacteriaceae bacterium]
MHKRFGVIITHPMQYYSPLFRKISESGKIELKVFYTWSQAQGKKYDPGFGKEVDWDIPLLDRYDYTFVNNISKKPGSNHFNGIVNPTLIREIEEWNADAVLIIGWNFNSHLKAMRYFKGKIPVYFRGDSTLLDERSELKKIARRIFLRWVYSYIDYAFYVGTRNKEYFLAHGLKPEQLIFAPHAIDNERFYDKDGSYRQKALEWRRSLGIKDDDFVFLFAGKLEPKKNPMLLLKAFMQLNLSREINPSISPGNSKSHLIFVGNGVLENELKNYITRSLSLPQSKDIIPSSVSSRAKSRDEDGKLKQDLPDGSQVQLDNKSDDATMQQWNNPSIHFLDFHNQSAMPIVYRLGNVFVLPSISETWGLAVNEAMACGLPVIVSDKVGCAFDLVEQDENGYIFKSNDEKELMKVMNLCIDKWKNDKNKFDEMGFSSLNKIQGYSMDVLAENILASLVKV